MHVFLRMSAAKQHIILDSQSREPSRGDRTEHAKPTVAFGSSLSRDKSCASSLLLQISCSLFFPRTRNLVRIWTSSWRTYRHLAVWYCIPEVRHPRPWSAAVLLLPVFSIFFLAYSSCSAASSWHSRVLTRPTQDLDPGSLAGSIILAQDTWNFKPRVVSSVVVLKPPVVSGLLEAS